MFARGTFHTFWKQIAKNTGYDIKLIRDIKKYVFEDKHDMSDGYKRFVPDFYMAQSWQRLIEGNNIQHHDLLLLDHELYEKY